MQPVAVTRTRLVADLRRLGVQPGAVVMVHARMSALGWVVGGSEAVVRALLEAVGPEGTLMALASWEEHVYNLQERPEHLRPAYAEEPPVFDLETSEAVHEHGRIPERLRTWPGAQRSVNPEASVVAVGARSAWITAEQPDGDAYGARTPFARLVEAGGQVLMLGAPLDTVTLTHHAEAIARAPDKRKVTFRVRVAVDGGGAEDREYTDIDTSRGAYRYEDLDLGGDDETEVMSRAALEAGIGVRGTVGEGECHLFPAPELTAFLVDWIDERFDNRPPSQET